MFKGILTFIWAMILIVNIVGCGGSNDQAEKQSMDTKPKNAEVIFAVENFTSSDNCGGCHNSIYEQWSGSMHNNALRDPIYKKVLELGSKETDGAIDIYCLKCHGPIAVMTGEIPPVDGSMAGSISINGVQCDFCHTVSRATGIGNAAFENTPGAVKRGPFDDAKPTAHQAEYSELHTKAEFCGMCHDVNHPTNGLALEATYTEWKNGPYAAEGIQCQDCHMTPGPGVTKPNPGKAVDFGEDRAHIYTHNVAGANFAVTRMLGSDEHALLAEKRLKAAAKIEILNNSIKKTDDGLNLQVKVSNVGAGHYLPTGLTETREMWLEVTVKDASGKILWQTGGLDEKGNIKPGSVVYNTIVLDKNGHHTEKVWEAEKIGSDHRIPPRESVIESYNAKAGQVSGKINITARLLYRSASQHLIDELFGAETFKVPQLEMTNATTSVSI